MNILIEKIKKHIFGSGTNYIVLLGIVGILLLMIGEITPEKKEEMENTGYYTDYKNNIENQLEKLLSSVKGAGNVSVMVTLESGQETVYVQQEKSVKDQSNVSGDKSDQQTIKDSYENEIASCKGCFVVFHFFKKLKNFLFFSKTRSPFGCLSVL